ncbi:hypothetical protein BJ322DRAFT_168007 [Thelephora terrestris]|uniref:Uncharacterized protein n=1 Tax=Thelephora terrestris TaxID=56493 RepID=A0A9P6L4V5_9AGAM|nr:hypothetical protein BJ322DRAFT_168007 [Thelephora terrestris]
MPRLSSPARSTALFISTSGCIVNLLLALKFNSLWSSLNAAEPESEWEGSLDSWSGESLTLLWGLLSCYFAAEAVSSLVGFIGIVKNIPSFVRFCRDYSIADLFFVIFAAISGAYVISNNTSIRTGLCEDVSSQPDFIRDLADMGFNLENCEVWFERAVIGLMTLSAAVIIIRVHFVIAISSYYSQLSRSRSSSTSTTYTALRPTGNESLHRIYLLPTPTSSASSRSADGKPEMYVYSPVPLSSLSEVQTREMKAAEAWISHTEPSPRSSHRSSHRHHHSGRISLPVRSEEGVPPKYEKFR